MNDGIVGDEDENVSLYDSLQECCEDAFASGCNYEDVCNPGTETPNPMEDVSYTTPDPTPFPTTEPSPSFTLSATKFTMLPTFGSTPTVSKETSGPPTMTPKRTGKMLEY